MWRIPCNLRLERCIDGFQQWQEVLSEQPSKPLSQTLCKASSSGLQRDEDAQHSPLPTCKEYHI